MQGGGKSSASQNCSHTIPGPLEAEFGSRAFNLSLKLDLITDPGAEFPDLLPLPSLQLGGREGDGEDGAMKG